MSLDWSHNYRQPLSSLLHPAVNHHPASRGASSIKLLVCRVSSIFSLRQVWLGFWVYEMLQLPFSAAVFRFEETDLQIARALETSWKQSSVTRTSLAWRSTGTSVYHPSGNYHPIQNISASVSKVIQKVPAEPQGRTTCWNQDPL